MAKKTTWKKLRKFVTETVSSTVEFVGEYVGLKKVKTRRVGGKGKPKKPAAKNKTSKVKVNKVKPKTAKVTVHKTKTPAKPSSKLPAKASRK